MLDADLYHGGQWRISLLDSFGWVNAHYVNGAPPITNRHSRPPSHGATWSDTAKQYGDATSVGVIPAYRVYDCSAHLAIGPRYQLRFGVDNLLNAYYFTFRAVEYPGPGIIPSSGRTAHFGVVAKR